MVRIYMCVCVYNCYKTFTSYQVCVCVCRNFDLLTPIDLFSQLRRASVSNLPRAV